MNKSILKNFAIESRKDLMDRIKKKLNLFYIDENFNVTHDGDIYQLKNNTHTLNLTKIDYDKRELLLKRISEISLERVIEESAYTWFNRLIAIRYMELHDFLPLGKNNESLGIRVLSSNDNTPNPEILKFSNLMNEQLDIDFKRDFYIQGKDDNAKFKYILQLICNKLKKVFPDVFGGMTDYIDLLIPENMITETGFISKMIKEIPEDNFEQVEIIGWLYQYYNQTEKDRVISAKKAYKKNEIPYATQLFTPDWIVKYMVENSLGRYWIEHNNSDNIIENWKYFIKDNIDKQKDNLKPTDITFIDPCCGSGHILVYAFEVFYQIYIEAGYNKNDIPELILKNNIYGLDIDDRAGQLSILSVLLKAREYDKNIFNKEVVRNLNIMSIQESIDFSNLISTDNKTIIENVNYLENEFKNAKEIGSLLLLKQNDYSETIDYIKNDCTIFKIELENKLLPLIKQAIILSNKYDVVVTNPPYLNNNLMSPDMREYLQRNYSNVKSDLFSSFIEKNIRFGKDKSYFGYMTPYVWMFISSYANLRKYIIDNYYISSLVQLEYSALEEATVPICTFVISKNKLQCGNFIRLTDFSGGIDVQNKKYLETIKLKNNNFYYSNIKDFINIPGCPFAYWISKKIMEVFSNSKSLCLLADVKQGLSTADNNRFLRQWFEIDVKNALLHSNNRLESLNSNVKWFPFNKGGEFRKWYGNNDYVINYENNGKELNEFKKSVIRNSDYYFNKSITWSLISSSSISFRYKPFGHIFDAAGTSFFPKNENEFNYLLGLCNSTIVQNIMNFIAPTLNYTGGDIAKIPIIINDSKKDYISDLVSKNIQLSKLDWDSFETSWDFKKHPLLEFINSMPGLHDSNENVPPVHLKVIVNNYGEQQFIADELPLNAKIENSFKYWEEYCTKQFNTLMKNEEELNRIFIEIYGLQDELTPEVEDKDITIRKADKVRDIKSFISYAVGCMFGRYSLDEDGLIFAGGKFDESKYKLFKPDSDNIIPISDSSDIYYSDDIVGKFKDFVKVTFGEQTLDENIDFIAEVLGRKGTETSEDTIRRYFINDFYNDHLQIYQKRPIYWLVDSGKKNGFKSLIYMHRYDSQLMSKLRVNYLHKTQDVYDRLEKEISYKLNNNSLDNVERKILQTRLSDLNAKIEECKTFEEKIGHLANQMISIDLDDGVKVNYEKFADVLSKIK